MSNLNIHPDQEPRSPRIGKKIKRKIEPGQNSETAFLPHRPAKYTPITKTHVKVYVWELPVRVWHWINALAIVLLMITGIFIGNPFFSASVQEEAYYSFVMGWTRYIHFFAAFLFTISFIFRFYWSLKGNRYSISNPLRLIFWKETWETIKFYLFMKHKKPHYVGHNPLAQLSYLVLGIASIAMILTGFYLYIEPQPESWLGKMFIWVPFLFGNDSFEIRSWHHLVAWFFMIFMVVHIYLAFREDYLQKNGTMSSIFTGYKTEQKKHLGEDDNEK